MLRDAQKYRFCCEAVSIHRGYSFFCFPPSPLGVTFLPRPYRGITS